MSAVLPLTREPAGERDLLQREITGLAADVVAATRRLRETVAEKERLARLLDSVLESLDAGVVLCNDAREVIAANRVAQSLGLDRREIVDQLFSEAPDARVARRLCGETGPWWMVKRSQVQLPDGSAGTLLLIEDVTALKDWEERTRRRSNLETLGRMAAELAHEVRNPLGSLELFASLLIDELPRDAMDDEASGARELAEQILLGVRQLSGTVTRMLTAVRGGAATRSQEDAAALLREVLSFVAPVAQSREVTLLAVKARRPLAVAVDGEAVRQALLNLLRNALDATPRGGTVRANVWRRGAELIFEIEDDGPGIAKELRSRVFEPFFTTKEGGTGLGLALVERVALAHAGRIEVGDAPTGGAALRLILHLDEDSA